MNQGVLQQNAEIICAIKKQIYIYLVYLFLCSLLLFDHGGGADILFTAYLVVCIVVHILALFAVALARRNKEASISLISFLLFVGISFFLYPAYLSVMWNVTKMLKNIF